MFVLDEMAYEYEQKYDDVIRLTLGKSQLPPAASVVAAMRDAIVDQDQNNLVFPAGLPELRARIAQDYADRYDALDRPRPRARQRRHAARTFATSSRCSPARATRSFCRALTIRST